MLTRHRGERLHDDRLRNSRTNEDAGYHLGFAQGIVLTLLLCRERLGLSPWVGVGLSFALLACALLWMRQHRAAVARGEEPASFPPAQLRRSFWGGLLGCALLSGVSPFLMPWFFPSADLSLSARVCIAALCFLQFAAVLCYQRWRRPAATPPV